ncbi:uncharacterized protein LOC108852000 isoform X4 [Raphanus sativus]|uniref:Uncharacterized protein LOC108852000 isoform X4 n=1 Tax=Raphanus sativus TaxID=3726 RepID=A0A6J0N917_RAPSA|nr:uncharacterized protein LOC108852000 isoform X4 [Raphanus sativus]
MALNPSRVLNDMDSDDEPFLARIHGYFDAENSASYEITEDMFEKASYVKQLDHLTLVEIQELMVGVRSLEPIWRTKRQSKRMPLIRHLQHPEGRRAMMMMEMPGTYQGLLRLMLVVMIVRNHQL